MFVITVDESFVETGSPMLEVTDAVLLTVVGEAGAVTLTAIGFAEPTASEAIVQVMVGGVAPSELQVQPVPATELSETPLGSVSVTVAFVAALGPRFSTDNV